MTNRVRQSLQYVLAYLLWVVTLGLALYDAYMIRVLYLLPFQLAASPRRPPAVQLDLELQRSAVDRFGIVLLLLGMVVLAVWLEHYYRTGVENGRLLVRFCLVMTIGLGVLFVADVVASSHAIHSGRLALAGVCIPVIELALLVLFAWLYARLAKPFAGD